MNTYSTLAQLPPRSLCQILPRYGPHGLPIFWEMVTRASKDEAYLPVVHYLLKLARAHPSEGLSAVNNFLRGLDAYPDADVVRVVKNLCQEGDNFEDFWALINHSDRDLTMFLGFLLRAGLGSSIKKKAIAEDDKTQRSRIVNTLWNAILVASKNQKILLTNVKLVHDALGSLSITEEIKSFAQGPKTEVEDEVFGWNETLKKEHIQKALKPLL
jgi:hypothetical protein